MLRILLSLAFAILLSAGESAVIGRWPMTQDASGSIPDISGNGNHGRFTGTYLGTYLYVQANTVDFGSAPAVQIGSDSLSIACWLAPSPVVAGNDARRFSRVLGFCGGDSFLAVDMINDGRLVLGLGFRKPDDSWPSISITSERNLPWGAWKHVALVIDRQAGMARIHVGGIESARMAIPPEILTHAFTGGTLSIGAVSNGFEGCIRELAITRTALSADEIRAQSLLAVPAAPVFPEKPR